MIRTLLAALTLAVTARAGVVVVDPAGGPGGGALLQAALDAAQPGDILLLRSGDYSDVQLLLANGKGLTLLADSGHALELPTLKIHGVPLGERVLVRGIAVRGTLAFGLEIEGDGQAWVEDCRAISPDALPGEAPFAGLEVLTSHVVVARGHYVGGRGGDAGPGEASTFGGAGVVTQCQHAALFGVIAQGGRGGDGLTEFFLQADGGPGLRGNFGDVLVSGGTFTGGDEGLAEPPNTQGGAGAEFNFPTVYRRGPVLLPGGVTGAGFPGVPLDMGPGALVNLKAPPRQLAISSPVREFGTVRVAVSGQPGDLATLFLASDWFITMDETLQGAHLLQPLRIIPLGTLDAEGQLDVTSQLPALPPGVDGLTMLAQLHIVGAKGHATLCGASSLTWISAAF